MCFDVEPLLYHYNFVFIKISHNNMNYVKDNISNNNTS